MNLFPSRHVPAPYTRFNMHHLLPLFQFIQAIYQERWRFQKL